MHVHGVTQHCSALSPSWTTGKAECKLAIPSFCALTHVEFALICHSMSFELSDAEIAFDATIYHPAQDAIKADILNSDQLSLNVISPSLPGADIVNNATRCFIPAFSLHTAVLFSLQSLCLMHIGKPTSGNPPLHNLVSYQANPHYVRSVTNHLWDHCSTRQLWTLIPRRCLEYLVVNRVHKSTQARPKKRRLSVWAPISHLYWCNAVNYIEGSNCLCRLQPKPLQPYN